MENEDKLIKKKNFIFKFHTNLKRYVDDCFCITQVTNIYNTFNNFHPQQKFTEKQSKFRRHH